MQLKKDASEDKLRGGFYTPETIAEFMIRWTLADGKGKEILEPSCGDGIFLRMLSKSNYIYDSILGIELKEEEANKSKEIELKNKTILQGDFLDFCLHTEKRFDTVIGNPPYIRYQFLDKRQQVFSASIFKKAGIRYSKLTNVWVSFVVGATLLLKDNSRMAFVLPAELLQVGYAAPLRKFLTNSFNLIHIVSFQKLVFPEIQQEVVLLFCEKDGSSTHKMEHVEVKDANSLANLNLKETRDKNKRINFTSDKWTTYFLSQEEIDFLEKIRKDTRFKKLSDYASVEVGITTGANPYFTVPLSVVKRYNLEKYACPLVGRSVQVPSVVFSEKDWAINRDNDKIRSHLLVFPPINRILGEQDVLEYLSLGIKHGVNKGYKCRIRDEWQVIPSVRLSDAFFIRRSNFYPKLIINEANAFTTDTMHRVSLKDGVDIKAFAASYYNSLSLAFSELCGRSHGGGVLELMPNEAASIILPYHINNGKLLSEIDRHLRENRNISELLETTDKFFLTDNFGLAQKDVDLANSIWKKLQNRRLSRSKG